MSSDKQNQMGDKQQMFVQQRNFIVEQKMSLFYISNCGATQDFSCATHNRLAATWSSGWISANITYILACVGYTKADVQWVNAFVFKDAVAADPHGVLQRISG